MFERAVLIHYHEIGLKGRNRSAFENRLRTNLGAAVRDLTAAPVERAASRLVVPISDHARREELLEACAAIPGVVRACDSLVLSRDMHDIKSASEMAMREAFEAAGVPPTTFAVEARRSNTDHPVSSVDMNIQIGQHLKDTFGLAVDLGHPDLTVWVEVVQGGTFVYARRLSGPGGLPVGMSGRVVGLLSAGIDSPVACWRILKRGAVVVGVHFSGAPQTADTSTDDVFEIVRALQPAMGIGRIYSVPFGDLQRKIMLECPPDLRILLYRRLMIRIAEAIAHAEGARALVTGESLGQVASQTLENIAAVDAVATMPVLRPLVGSDKQEIIAEARRLGTYEISIQPHPDCCTLFMPRTPSTHASVEELDAAEAPLDMDEMIAEGLAGVTYRDFPCPAYRSPKGGPGTLRES